MGVATAQMAKSGIKPKSRCWKRGHNGRESASRGNCKRHAAFKASTYLVMVDQNQAHAAERVPIVRMLVKNATDWAYA